MVSAGAVASAVTRSASAAAGVARHAQTQIAAPAARLRAVAGGSRHAADVARRAVSAQAARRICGVAVGHGLHGFVGGDRGPERHHGHARPARERRLPLRQERRGQDVTTRSPCRLFPCCYDLAGKDYNAANQDIMRSKPQLVKYYEACLALARTGGAYRTEAERDADEEERRSAAPRYSRGQTTTTTTTSSPRRRRL